MKSQVVFPTDSTPMSTRTPNAEPVDVLDAFRARVRDRATVCAVETTEGTHSYEALEALALSFAGTIEHLTDEACPRVLIALPPSARAYAAMLGTLMAGGTSCPVDLTVPDARNAVIAGTFAPDVVFFEGRPPVFFSTLPVTIPRADARRLLAPSTRTRATDRSEVAYVIFTSGSTGHPKGVKIARRGFSHFLSVCPGYFATDAGEKWGQFSSLAHDLGVMDVFMALTQHATLVPLSEAERKLRPAKAIRDRRIGIWQSVPSAIDLMIQGNQLNTSNLASLRLVSLCGEPLRRDHLQALFSARSDLVVLNTYGATETTGFNTVNRLTADNYPSSCALTSVAIGHMVPGWTIQLRAGDSEDEGEIVVVGNHLSAGYWRDEEGTRAAFREVNSDGSRAERCYLTGDWGVRRDGQLYCSGRIDRQVKIRGERIELEEIDGLLRSAGFRAAYTVCQDKELHSFVETTDTVDQERVRAHLQQHLPFHAVPRVVHALASLPRTPSGKVDRRALLEELK